MFSIATLLTNILPPTISDTKHSNKRPVLLIFGYSTSALNTAPPESLQDPILIHLVGLVIRLPQNCNRN